MTVLFVLVSRLTCPAVAVLFANVSAIVQQHSSTLQVVKGHSQMQRSATPWV